MRCKMKFITAMQSADGFLMQYHLRGVSHQYCCTDGSMLSSPSLHVWKVAANSVIDAQIQVLVVCVHTYIYHIGLFGTHWYHHHPVLQRKHYFNAAIQAFILRVMPKILDLYSCAEGLALHCSSL